MTGPSDPAPPSRAWTLRRALAITCGLALIIALSRAVPFELDVTVLRSWVASHGVVGMVGFGAAYVAAALVFVPGAALTLVAGGIFGLGWGMVIVSVSTSAADAVSFLAARYFARGAVERLTTRYPRIGAVDQAITQGGWRIVAMLRLSPTIPYSASNYLYGLTGISFFPYLLASGIFTLPGTFAYVYLGYVGAETLGGSSRSVAQWTLLGVGLTATILAAVYFTVLARRALAQLHAG